MRNEFAKVTNPNDFVTESGSPIHILYAPTVLSDGSVVLEESGKENTDDMIQSYGATSDINYIVSRLLEGDESVLAQRQGMYGDFTQFPTTYAEVLQTVINSEKRFNALSPDVKQKFDNDFGKWLATATTPEWLDKMGIKIDNSEEVVKDES